MSRNLAYFLLVNVKVLVESASHYRRSRSLQQWKMGRMIIVDALQNYNHWDSRDILWIRTLGTSLQILIPTNLTKNGTSEKALKKKYSYTNKLIREIIDASNKYIKNNFAAIAQKLSVGKNATSAAAIKKKIDATNKAIKKKIEASKAAIMDKLEIFSKQVFAKKFGWSRSKKRVCKKTVPTWCKRRGAKGGGAARGGGFSWVLVLGVGSAWWFF